MLLRKLDICAQKEIRCQSYSTYENQTSKTIRRKWGNTLRYWDRWCFFYNKIFTAQQHKQNQANGITLSQGPSASRCNDQHSKAYLWTLYTSCLKVVFSEYIGNWNLSIVRKTSVMQFQNGKLYEQVFLKRRTKGQ